MLIKKQASEYLVVLAPLVVDRYSFTMPVSGHGIPVWIGHTGISPEFIGYIQRKCSIRALGRVDEVNRLFPLSSTFTIEPERGAIPSPLLLQGYQLLAPQSNNR